MSAPLPPKDRFASGSAPVNRRTVRQPVVAEPVRPHASVRQRLARVQAQHRLGGALSQRLLGRGGLRGAGAGGHSGWAGIALAVGGTVCACGGLVAWLQQSAAVGVVAGLVGCVAAGGGWWLHRRCAAGPHADAALPDLFDAPALAQLDEVLRQLASEVSDAHLQQLRSLADTLARMAPLMRQTGVNEHFTQDDHFYVTECVRRYWPDTLQAYVRVPRSGRTTPGQDGQTADGLLAAQLGLLQHELSKREQGLVRASAAAQEQQQRFLQAKGTQGPLR